MIYSGFRVSFSENGRSRQDEKRLQILQARIFFTISSIQTLQMNTRKLQLDTRKVFNLYTG